MKKLTTPAEQQVCNLEHVGAVNNAAAIKS